MTRIWRTAALALAALLAVSCSSGGLFRQYEYEEDVYLSLDGTAVVSVNSSVPALDALRGATLDTRPSARLDRDAVEKFFTTPITRVTHVSGSRRRGRRFLHVLLDVDDVRRLDTTAPFNWASYEFRHEGNEDLYRQTLGASAGKSVRDVGWNGSEFVAFRLHLPSKITYHTNNAGVDNRLRGNVLLWEQPLAERLKGEPLVLDARMQTQSILYRTLLLFGGTIVVVAATFAAAVVFVLRGGKKKGAGIR